MSGAQSLSISMAARLRAKHWCWLAGGVSVQVLTQSNFRAQRDFISYATIIVIVVSIIYFLVVFTSEVVITLRKPGAGKEKKGTKRSRAADSALSVNAQDGGVDGVAKEATSAMVNPLFLGSTKQGASGVRGSGECARFCVGRVDSVAGGCVPPPLA